MRILLAAGLDPEAQNTRGESPMDIAWTKPNSNVFFFLILLFFFFFCA